jgi:hypothetical protein
VLGDAWGGSAVLERDVESLLAYSGQTGKLDDCLHETVSGLILSAGAPTRIGPYRIERVLGSGGMGTVYLGVRDDDELPSRVALKVLQAGSSESLVERFRRERRILAGLIHPYITRLLDAGKLDDGRPYFVMEYVDGQTIDQYVALHQPAVLELFLKALTAPGTPPAARSATSSKRSTVNRAVSQPHRRTGCGSLSNRHPGGREPGRHRTMNWWSAIPASVYPC